MGALDGLTVLDLGLLVQGPQAAALLRDMGASVVKVELPGVGDQARWIPLGPGDPRSGFFEGCNRGKRSVTIDLRRPEGADVFRRLAASADIVISNFKTGTLDEWGLGYEALREINPGIIWAAGSAFGPVGPDREREGADLAGQAAGGLISTTGGDGAEPTPVGVTIADHIGSLNLVSGVLAALVARADTGLGQKVEVSLLGGQIWAQASELSYYLMTDRVPGRSNYGHPMIPAAYRIFRTADGWIGLIGIPPAARPSFLEALGRPELADDPLFGDIIPTPQQLAGQLALLEEIFPTKTSDEWAERLHGAGVRYAPVRDYAGVAADPGAWENGYLVEVDDAERGRVKVVGNPIRMSATPLSPGVRTPELGQHTEEVLLEHGYSWDDIAALREIEVI
ncbi:MAG: CoA transferase [Acidimicrobiia bacterium]|nr:CoA transferase [Acidimicrobiia bacterium]